MSTFTHQEIPVRQPGIPAPPRRRRQQPRPLRTGDPVAASSVGHPRPTPIRATRLATGRNETPMTPGPGHNRRKESDLRFKHELMEQVRRQKKMTQSELARRTGMKQPGISAIEGGEWPPTLFNAYRIAKTLERNLEEFIEEIEVELDDQAE